MCKIECLNRTLLVVNKRIRGLAVASTLIAMTSPTFHQLVNFLSTAEKGGCFRRLF